MTRIFRRAHSDGRLVEQAMEAERLWRAWEGRFGRRLVGDEGLIAVGEEIVPAWDRAMLEAGALHRLLSPQECQTLFPVCRVGDSPALVDPAAGAIRVRRTTELLIQAVGDALRLEEVYAIERRAGACLVRTARDGWSCDEVLLTAGTETNALAAPLGLDVPTRFVRISRFTYPLRPAYRELPVCCWVDDGKRLGEECHAYGSPVGTTGSYAVGVSWTRRGAGLDAELVSRETRRQAEWYLGEALPGLDPEPLAELRCTYPDCDFAVDGDGFLARHSGHVTAIHGDNLFKFAPLLGALLRDTALTGALPPALTMLETKPTGRQGGASVTKS
jgi:sarcosine oxidase